MFKNFCQLLYDTKESYQRICEEQSYQAIVELVNEIRSILEEFDENWVEYEKLYPRIHRHPRYLRARCAMASSCTSWWTSRRSSQASSYSSASFSTHGLRSPSCLAALYANASPLLHMKGPYLPQTRLT